MKARQRSSLLAFLESLLILISIDALLMTNHITLKDTLGRSTYNVDLSIIMDPSATLIAVAALSVLLGTLQTRPLPFAVAYLSAPALLSHPATRTIALIVLTTTSIARLLVRNHRDSVAGASALVITFSMLGILNYLLKLAGRNPGVLEVAWKAFWLPLHATAPLAFLSTLVAVITMTLYKKDNRPHIPAYREAFNKHSRRLLLSATLLALALGIAPYASTINPSALPVNVDWMFYHEILLNIRENGGLIRALSKTIGTVLAEKSIPTRPAPLMLDRVLFLALLHVASQVFNPYIVAVYVNIPLLMILPLAYYKAVKGVWRDEEAALYAALLTPLSVQFFAFMYGGFQASLMATILALLALSHSGLRGYLAWILSLLNHTVTGAGYMAAHFVAKALRKQGRVLGLLAASLLLTTLLAVLLAGRLPGRIVTPLEAIGNLSYTMTTYLWGVLGITPFYLLVAIGVILAGKGPDTFQILLLSLLLTLFLEPGLQARAVVNAPLIPFAGLGLRMIGKHSPQASKAILLLMASIALMLCVEAPLTAPR